MMGKQRIHKSVQDITGKQDVQLSDLHNTLRAILKELQKIEIHMSEITSNRIQDTEVGP